MLVLLQDLLEEGGAGGDDDLVRLHLLVLACQGHVVEIWIIFEVSESVSDVLVEIIPLQTERV